MLADFSKVVLLPVGMISANKAVEFIQFDVLGRDVSDGLWSLVTGASTHRWMTENPPTLLTTKADC
jgi:hypothetical protein